jgi:hypothetical protein
VLTVAELLKKPSMQHECSLSCSQNSATEPYPSPVECTPCFFKVHFKTFYHLRVGFPSNLFPAGFPSKMFYVFMISHACCYCVQTSISLMRFKGYLLQDLNRRKCITGVLQQILMKHHTRHLRFINCKSKISKENSSNQFLTHLV